jgi:chromosome segregation ATPase
MMPLTSEMERKLHEANSEIEYLKSINQRQAEYARNLQADILRLKDDLAALSSEQCDSIVYKDLFTLAADALECGVCVPEDWTGLIKELREAAE